MLFVLLVLYACSSVKKSYSESKLKTDSSLAESSVRKDVFTDQSVISTDASHKYKSFSIKYFPGSGGLAEYGISKIDSTKPVEIIFEDGERKSTSVSNVNKKDSSVQADTKAVSVSKSSSEVKKDKSKFGNSFGGSLVVGVVILLALVVYLKFGRK